MAAPSDRPWMTALEMQFAALSESQRALQRVDRNQALAGDYRTPIVRVIRAFKRAETYSWSGDTAKAAYFAAQTIPHTSVFSSQAMPGTAGWWWFDRPPCESLHGLLWHHDEDGLWLHVFAADKPDGGKVPLFLAEYLWRRGESLRDMIARQSQSEQRIGSVSESGFIDETVVSDEGIREAAAFYAAGSAWLQQRVVVSAIGHVERHRRKQLAREHGAVVSDVKVIELRRTNSSDRLSTASDSDPFDWSCRWIVNGHWRNQPYKDDRKLIYILPHVKGPADKPLKVPTHTVYAVRR